MDDNPENPIPDQIPGDAPQPEAESQPPERADFIEEPELFPEKPAEQPETPAAKPEGEESQPEEPEAANADSLESLRKSLQSQEPEPEVKQNLFSRMAGNLKRPGANEPTFGVKTAANAPTGGDDDLQDDFFQQRLGTPNDPLKPAGAAGEPEPTTENNAEQNAIAPLGENAGLAALGEGKPALAGGFGIDWDEDAQPRIGTNQPEKAEDSIENDRPSEETKATEGKYHNPQRFIAYNPKQTLGQRFNGLNRLDRILIIILLIAVIGLIGFLGSLYYQSLNQQPVVVAPTPTAAPTATSPVPIPVGLHLPGGWSFPLKVGSIVDGKWTPQTSEWLQGTEIRRVVAIPKNDQLQAVFQTFSPGDVITLDISNGDALKYTVKSVSQVPVTDSNILYDTSPSLAVILFDPTSESRWVIIAVP